MNHDLLIAFAFIVLLIIWFPYAIRRHERKVKRYVRNSHIVVIQSSLLENADPLQRRLNEMDIQRSLYHKNSREN